MFAKMNCTDELNMLAFMNKPILHKRGGHHKDESQKIHLWSYGCCFDDYISAVSNKCGKSGDGNGSVE